ncbi:MAG: hypothetical protein SFV81_07095 [Pirellulaceae bacterium]|nr:hypothetical protein [Pirellulaceae bacterium]
MPIKLKCSCGQVLSVPDNLAGKTGKCPKCQNAIKIPHAAPAPATANAAAASVGAATKAPAAKAKPAAKPAAPMQVAAAQPTNKFDSLLDEVGLTKKTGPVCPKCGVGIRPGTVLCTGCGLNFETGEVATSFEAAAATFEFKNEFLQEAAHNMTRDVVMDERREKAGLPWWMLMSYLLGAVTLCAAGVVIVDGRFNEPAEAGTFLGNIQRLPVFVVLGVTAMLTGQFIHAFAHLSIVVFGFKQGWGPGFGCLLIPFFSYIYGIMHWADNRQALMAVVTSIVTVSAGIGMIIYGGGFGTIQAIM